MKFLKKFSNFINESYWVERRDRLVDTYSRPLDELSELIGKCNHHITHHGKGRGQGKILKILARNGEMSQKDLQDMLEIQSGSISEVLAKLEDKGMITRTKSEDDKRKVKEKRI